MKRRAINGIILGIFTILYLILFGALKSYSFDFSLGQTYETTVIDVNKPDGDGFKNTCTHATVANAMAFAIGKNASFAYRVYRTAVDLVGNITTSPDVVFNAIMDAAGAADGFFRYANIHQVSDNNGRDWRDLIKSQIFGGFVIILALDIPGQVVGHAITVYGFSQGPGKAISLLYVDSDDGVSKSFMGLLSTDINNVTTLHLNNYGDLKIATVRAFVAIRVVGKK